MLCNNDIEVRPRLARALLECAESAPDVGIVTPKYLYPDGTLNEAGAIIWRDGTGANYGRGEDPPACQSEYRREVDYGSAAALMVRAELWRERRRLRRALRADVLRGRRSLLRRARAGVARDLRTRAEVIHVEGATAGTDIEPATSATRRSTGRSSSRSGASGSKPSTRAHDLQRARGGRPRRGPRVLVVDHRVPMWDHDAGSLRMREIYGRRWRARLPVTLLPDNSAPLQPYTRVLAAPGVEVLYGDRRRSRAARARARLALAILAGRTRPAAGSTRSGSSRRERRSSTTRSICTGCARRARGDRAGGGEPELLSPRAAAIRELELALMRATDVTIVVSEPSASRFRATCPGRACTSCRRPRDPRATSRGRTSAGDRVRRRLRAPAERRRRARWSSDVMPRVWRELPERGDDRRRPPRRRSQALASPRVEVAGWVEDLEPLLVRARCSRRRSLRRRTEGQDHPRPSPPGCRS